MQGRCVGSSFKLPVERQPGAEKRWSDEKVKCPACGRKVRWNQRTGRLRGHGEK